MNALKERDLLREAAETHHVIYRIVDGDNPEPVQLDRDYHASASAERERPGTRRN
jgi:hypothetical protein